MTKNCKNCVFYKKLKIQKRVPQDTGFGLVIHKEITSFEETHCCSLCKDELDGFLLEVRENDMCDRFEEKI